MKSKNVLYFTQREEEFSELLTKIGIKRNVSKVLVYLANTPEATSRDIERGTDLRQPEVSIAMAAMMEQKWVESRENKAENKGRPVKIYKLALPINEIMDNIERNKRAEANNQLKMIKQLRDYIGES
ncbi:MAG: MarR family transcriptional regulator [Candidatus Staskawiczbacteria bacterium]